MISPMCHYSAHDGHVDDWHLVHLGRFAIGGAGIVVTETIAIEKRGRITHGCPGGWTLEDTVVLAAALKRLGVGVMDGSSSGIAGPATAGANATATKAIRTGNSVTSGATSPQRRQPGFQVPDAERIRTEIGMTTMAVGLITDPRQAEAILTQVRADLIAIGREAPVDPMWTLHAARSLGYDTEVQIWPR
jgi:2,4-dienoyl-CoA reductase-like NADH-dependent reductase (Old Yellow Enzyme family)